MAIKVNEKRCIQKVNKFLSMLCKQLKVVKARVEDCRDVGKNGTGLTWTRNFENVTFQIPESEIHRMNLASLMTKIYGYTKMSTMRLIYALVNQMSTFF